jgi:citrate synthase
LKVKWGVSQIPSLEQVKGLSAELSDRAALPAHIPRMLNSLPKDTHPMTQLSMGVLALQVRLEESS